MTFFSGGMLSFDESGGGGGEEAQDLKGGGGPKRLGRKRFDGRGATPNCCCCFGNGSKLRSRRMRGVPGRGGIEENGKERGREEK